MAYRFNESYHLNESIYTMTGMSNIQTHPLHSLHKSLCFYLTLHVILQQINTDQYRAFQLAQICKPVSLFDSSYFEDTLQRTIKYELPIIICRNNCLTYQKNQILSKSLSAPSEIQIQTTFELV